MKFWIKDIDWDRIWYSQEVIDEEYRDNYTMWVPNVHAVVQSNIGGRIRLLDRHGKQLVSIECNAFSSMEIINDYEQKN